VGGIPAELDELVLALIDLDPDSRPSSAAEVMDRLGAIAGIAPDYDERVQRSYLHGAQLVGRDAERQWLTARLNQAFEGGGNGVLIEGPSGLGKSSLLEDILRRARLAGARVVSVRARTQPNSLSVWTEIMRESALGPAAVAWKPGSDTPILKLAPLAPLVLAIDDRPRRRARAAPCCSPPSIRPIRRPSAPPCACCGHARAPSS